MRLRNKVALRRMLKDLYSNRAQIAFAIAWVVFLCAFFPILVFPEIIRNSPLLVTLTLGTMSAIGLVLSPLAKKSNASATGGRVASTNRTKYFELIISGSEAEASGQRFNLEELHEVNICGNTDNRSVSVTFDRVSAGFHDRVTFMCDRVIVDGDRKDFESFEDLYDFLLSKIHNGVSKIGPKMN